jgi:probable F420-dependent oxidoreductase
MQMKVGTWLPNFGYQDDDGIDHEARLKHWIVRSEQLGLDSIFVTDHLLRARNMYRRTWLEPMTSLAYAAALTSKPLLGPGVLLLPLRNPVMLAKMCATLQKLSNGRFVLGAGTGWFPQEFEAVGTRKSERGRRTDEVLEIVTRLCAGEELTYNSEFYHIDAVQIEPSPVKLPVWVGGGSQVAHHDSVEKPRLHPNVARRIARFADGWFSRPTAQANQIKDDWEQLQPYFEEAGRNPDQVEIVHGQLIHVTDERNRAKALEIQHQAAWDVLGSGRPRELLEQTYMFGTIDEIVENLINRSAAGIQHIVLHPFTDDPAQLELWAETLIPRLRAIEVQR